MVENQLYLGKVAGINLNLVFPVQLPDGKLFYYLDQSGDGTANKSSPYDSRYADAISHDLLDALLNFDQDTVDTQFSGATFGLDDSRTVNFPGFTLALPTKHELLDLQAVGAYPGNYLFNQGWAQANHYWSATQEGFNKHFALGLNGGAGGAFYDSLDGLFVAFQVILPPAYSISTSSTSVNEGSVASFTVATVNVGDGISLNYSLSGSGITASDVVGGSLSGTATVNNNLASFTVNLASDLTTEGVETLIATVQGQSSSVTVNDTSIVPPKWAYVSFIEPVSVTRPVLNGLDAVESGWRVAQVEETKIGLVDVPGILAWVPAPIDANSSSYYFDPTSQSVQKFPSTNLQIVRDVSYPVSGSSQIGIDSNFKIVLNGDFRLNAGTVRLSNSLDSRVIDLFDSSQVSRIDNSLIINPLVDLRAGSSYLLSLSSGAIEDQLSGLDISSNSSIRFTTGLDQYRLSANTISVNEGGTVTFTIATTNVSDGTSLSYTLGGSGITATDVVSGNLTGTATVRNSQATFTVNLASDLTTEGTETLIATVQGQSSSVTVNDTSLTPTVTVSSTPFVVSESGANNLIYTFNRTGDVSTSLTLNMVVAGSASGYDHMPGLEVIPFAYLINGRGGVDSLAGSNAKDFFHIAGVVTQPDSPYGTASDITGTVAYGLGGDDIFRFYAGQTTWNAPAVSINGGAGTDTIFINGEHNLDWNISQIAITSVEKLGLCWWPHGQQLTVRMTGSQWNGFDNVVVESSNSLSNVLFYVDGTLKSLSDALVKGSLQSVGLDFYEPPGNSILELGSADSEVLGLAVSEVPDYSYSGTSNLSQITFAPGSSSATLVVDPIMDSFFEGNESVIVTIASGAGYVVGPSASATGWIDDTTPTYTLSANSENVSEGGAVTFTVATTNVANGTSLAYGLSGLGINGQDMVGGILSGTAIVSDNHATFTVNLASDSKTEGTESLVATVQGLTAIVTVIDTSTDPLPELIATQPLDNATGVGMGTNIRLSFTEAVQLGSGKIRLVNDQDHADDRIIDVTSGQVSVSGTDLVINPTVDLKPGAHYAVTLDGGVVKDLAGNPNLAMDDLSRLDFTIGKSSYTVGATPSSVNEGQSVSFVLETFNVAAGARETLNKSPRLLSYSETQTGGLRMKHMQCIKRLGTPEDVAGMVLFMASPAASFMSGQSVLIDGGSAHL